MKSKYGLIGAELQHSYSPAIHSLICEELKINGYYELYEIKKNQQKNLIDRLKSKGVKGVNVTIPYKVSIIQFLDNISDEAKKIGAINTVFFCNNKTYGYNTDYFGFGIMLNRFNIKLAGSRAVILGSGGAAKAVLQYLVDNRATEVTIVSRNVEKAKCSFKEFRTISYQEINKIGKQEIIINATPCGMYPYVNNSPIQQDDLANFSIAIDLIYNPLETLFLKYAKNNGMQTVNGLFMLVSQAVKAQEIWNQIRIKAEIIDTVYRRIVQQISC